MAPLKQLISIAFMLSLACADDPAKGGDNLNLTVSFFTSDEQQACQDNDASKGIELTTSTVPSGATCFNIKDIFSPQQRNTTGFQNSSQPIYGGVDAAPNGVSWLIRNKDHYDPKANYSNVWFRQVNESGTRDEGKPASWVFYTYAFADCEQQDPEKSGDDTDPKDNPWFETSCQTSEDGQCKLTPNPIVSFYINTAKNYNPSHGGCEKWAKMGDAGVLNPEWKVAIALAGVMAFFLTL